MSDETVNTYPRPEGVRIVKADGTVIECELAWNRLTDEGIALWRVATKWNPQKGDQLQVDKMPGRAGISLPADLGGFDIGRAS